MEYRHNPGGFSGSATGSATASCSRCGMTVDVLHQQTAAGEPRTYTVRCPNLSCNAPLSIDLTAPPIAVIARPTGPR